MDKEQIIERLTTIVRPYVTATVDAQPIALTGSEHLVKDLRVDSVDVIEIILDIEKEFEIQIDDNEIRNVMTLNDLTTLIEGKAK